MEPITLLVLVIVAGIVLAFVPMEPLFKNIAIAIIAILFLFWVLGATGVYHFG